jgi:hypothetical protein
MNEFKYIVVGLCFATGVICMLTGSPVLGGVNLFLAILNYHLAD